MKKGVCLPKLYWPYRWRFSFWREQFHFTARGKKSTEISSSTAIAKSPKSEGRRPSFYLSLPFLALAASGYLALNEEPESHDPNLHILKEKGWVNADAMPCDLGAPGFYELENEFESREIYLSANGSLLTASPPPWPEPPVACRNIPKPSFVKEI